jgi:hypothetical protein
VKFSVGTKIWNIRNAHLEIFMKNEAWQLFYETLKFRVKAFLTSCIIQFIVVFYYFFASSNSMKCLKSDNGTRLQDIANQLINSLIRKKIVNSLKWNRWSFLAYTTIAPTAWHAICIQSISVSFLQRLEGSSYIESLKKNPHIFSTLPSISNSGSFNTLLFFNPSRSWTSMSL